MNEPQSRRTNILVGDEVLTKIDDSQNVTHTNGVMKVVLNTIPNPLTIGTHQIVSAGDYLNVIIGGSAKAIAYADDLPPAVTWQTLGGKPETFPLAAHTHDAIDDISFNVRGLIGNELLAGTIALMPSALLSTSNYWYGCDGYAIERRLPAGQMLVAAGCPYGVGDGINTVNLPDFSAETTPTGCVYCLYVGFAP